MLPRKYDFIFFRNLLDNVTPEIYTTNIIGIQE